MSAFSSPPASPPASPAPLLIGSWRERVSRLVYTGLWTVATPAIAAYLLWRSRRQPAYRSGWCERFLGRYRGQRTGPCVWIHAVSVGETRAAAPLVLALRARYPELSLLVTHMTPTGRDTAIELFGNQVSHAYLAYDYRFSVAHFLHHWRPVVGIVMETEIWPNLMVAARAAGVPMLLVNGRLSAKSLRNAMRWRSLMRPATRGFARILAQGDDDATRFAALTGDANVSSIVRVGNLKFDIDVPVAQRELAMRFRERIASGGSGPRSILLFASTREGEEAAIFDAWMRRASRVDARISGTSPLLVVVPRHPQRFDEVSALASARGLIAQPRSDGRPVAADTQVWIGDSMGELFAYYLVADVAYVGGSLVPLGGQNLIEAAAVGCPVLIGPHTFNFSDTSDEAVRAGAAIRVADFDALVEEALAIACDGARRRRMAGAGMVFAAAHRGATERTMEIIASSLRAGIAVEAPSRISRS